MEGKCSLVGFFANFAVPGELCAKESLFFVQIPLTQSSQRTAKIANKTHGNRAVRHI